MRLFADDLDTARCRRPRRRSRRPASRRCLAMDSVGVVAPHLGVLRRGRGNASGRPEVAPHPHSEEIPATVAGIHRTGQFSKRPSGLDAMATSRRCGRSRARLRPPVGESARQRTKIDSRVHCAGAGPGTDGSSAIRVHLPRIPRPELDAGGVALVRSHLGAGGEPPRSVRDAVDPSTVRLNGAQRGSAGQIPSIHWVIRAGDE